MGLGAHKNLRWIEMQPSPAVIGKVEDHSTKNKIFSVVFFWVERKLNLSKKRIPKNRDGKLSGLPRWNIFPLTECWTAPKFSYRDPAPGKIKTRQLTRT